MAEVGNVAEQTPNPDVEGDEAPNVSEGMASSPRPSASPASTDAEIQSAILEDPQAFAPLYDRYLAPVYRYCLLRLETNEAAEAATAASFVRAKREINGIPLADVSVLVV